MSLATRCTACGTVFRVVQDQLKVSDGWVRCGRCNEVFNALECLFDLPPGAVPDVQAPASSAAHEEAPPGVEPPLPAAASPEVEPEVEPEAELEAEEEQFLPYEEEPDASPASAADFEDGRFNSVLLAEAGIAVPGEPDDGAQEAAPPVAPRPAFLRQAERNARWESPRAVLALALLCIALVLTGALQAALHFRDLTAAMLPEAAPALQALCEVAGCRVEPLRRIEDIVIDSSALTSAPSGEAVRLSLVLRNRSPLPLAMPSIDLTLTEVGGQMIARRALSPAELGARSPTLAASSESALQVVLSTGSRRASGYTVEPFYP